MRWFWASGLCLSLGYLTATACAEEVVWRPAAPRQAHVSHASATTAMLQVPASVEPTADSRVKQTAYLVPTPGTLLPWLRHPEPAALPGEITEGQRPTELLLEQPHGRLTEVSSAPAPAPAPTAQAVPFPGEVVPDSGEPALEEAVETCEEIQAPGPRFDLSGGYLLWWTRGSHLPPLVTTGPATALETVRGTLGSPGTTVLFGDTDANTHARSGGQVSIGYWHDPMQELGCEASFLFLGQTATRFSASSDQFPVLARPFFNLNLGIQAAQLLATPGILPTDFAQLQGKVTVSAPSQFWGAEANVRHNLLCGCDCRLDLFGGFRYLGLDEGLHIREDVMSLKAIPAPEFNVGNQIVVLDNFSTSNRFYGGQVGTQFELHRGRWILEGRTQLGLGVTHQVVDVNGSTSVSTPAGAVQQFNGGLLALSSNSGHFTRDHFSVVPQVGIKVAYQVTDELRVYAGYDFLFWSSVVRPADQVDLNLDVNLVPPPSGVTIPNNSGRTGPILPFRETNFWAQGVNCGLEFRY